MDVKPDFERLMARWDTVLKYGAYPIHTDLEVPKNDRYSRND